ncbi:cullin [Chloropicon primus]|uniref:Cullin-5 n=1 Tax=Chloropicon primus TaxID=1764295 RepID=A0A5B8MMR5_9CHLO|nr:cullin [Chloropicon primus]UPR00971.1 cullin [Chloropicon primus]|mmetsp:Transcript_12225/g.33935  ORF Transcript_12225/g.33935 Transcript_12225/m.33935 type:complete len:778 (+) Transcript_12225:440-2773(+)|eukprot:QDZ21749.1 cullin [Chloropicon primus]
MDREIIELQPGWEKCRMYINKLIAFLEKETESAFTSEEYMSFYTIVYNMCTQKNPYDFSQELYQRYRDSFTGYISERVAPALQEKNGEAMLHELTMRWENHKLMVRLLSRIFKYLDRYYVSRYNLDYLNDVGLMCFRDIVYEYMKPTMKNAVLSMVLKEREGEQIDRQLVKTVLEIFVEIGLGNMKNYEEDFEKYILEETSLHYRTKASEWIEDDSCPAYMIKAEKCLELEKDRVNQQQQVEGAGGASAKDADGASKQVNSGYFHHTTESRLLDCVEDELLAKYEMQLLEKENSGCVALLREDKKEDLARMYRLFSRIPKGKEPVAKMLSKHIESEGMAMVKECNERAEQAKAEALTKSKKERRNQESQETVFVKRLIKLHDKYLLYVQECFDNDALFHKALKEAFENFCHKQVANCACSELLASFCDNLLKKGSGEKLSGDAIEETFEKICKLLAYISDKDMYAEFYRKKLSKRLLFDRSANEDHERSMLARLKQQCGPQFTSKMEGMLTDLQVAKDNQGRFEQHLEKNPEKKPPLDLSVLVLTQGFWPSYPVNTMIIPDEMEKGIEIFKEFYDLKTKHRKLTWVFTLGVCHLSGRFGSPREKKYNFQMNTMQAAVMMLFNSEEKLSFGEVRDRLKLDDADVIRLLHSLSCAKYKLLLKNPPGKTVSKTDIFELNTKFQDKMARIRIPLPPVEQEKKKVAEIVHADRRYQIDAAIVRIMKARKVLKHSELMTETVTQLSSSFKPDVKTIKKRIMDLIERDFLERDKNDPQLFRYLA